MKGARIFGRARSSGLLDLASEGTVVFNDVDKLNKALLPRVLQLAVNGTYWSKAQHKEARVQSRPNTPPKSLKSDTSSLP